jgi:DNA polymerase III subunit gamma/tau
VDYLVLARKFRPQSFEEVVGQEHVVKTLRNAILQNRVAHAFIFGGPRGVGKTSVARILAKSLNCEKGPTPDPCQVCANCREITAGTSMDVREIDGASNRGIDEIRELREYVKFSPASSRHSIYIIDEVHMLTREAFNALLKTLEEPPAHVVFMFATTELHKVPATILSRCQCHDFRMIPIRQLSEKLKQIAEAENIRISQTGLSWIASAGNGSLRDAQSIFDQVISYCGSDIKDADIEDLLSLADRRYVFLLSEALLKKEAGKCLKIIEEAYYAGFDVKYFYQTLLNHFRNLLFIKIAGKDASLFDLSDDDLIKLRSLGEGASRDTIQRLLDILLSEEENMRRTQNPRLHLEALIARMAYLEELIPIDEILGRMEDLEKRLRGAPPGAKGGAGTRLSFTSPDAPSDSGSHRRLEEGRAAYGAQNGDQERLWEDYKTFVKKNSAPLWSKIEHGKFLGYADKVFSIGFPKDYIFIDDLKAKDARERIAEISRAFLRDDVEVKIEIIKSEGNNHFNKTNGGKKNNQDIRQEALNHPLLQKALDVFEGAEVREIIPRRNNF